MTAADRATFRRVAGLFAPYRRDLVVTAVLTLVAAAVGVVNPILIKVVFDRALFPAGGPRIGLLTALALAMAGLAAASSALNVGQAYLANRVGQHVLRDLRHRLFAHLQTMALSFFTETRTGEIQSRLTNDVNGAQGVLTSTLSTSLYLVVTFVSALVAMLALSWQLTLVALVSTPVFFFLTRWVGERRRAITSSAMASTAQLTATAGEALSVSGVLLSKVFRHQEGDLVRFDEANEEIARLQVRQKVIGDAFFSVVQLFMGATPALVYLVAGLSLRGGTGITAGTVVAFTTLQSRLFMPVGQLLQVVVELRTSLAFFDRIFAYLDLEPEVVEAVDGVTPPADAQLGHVELRDVVFRYDRASERVDLDHVDLEVRPGQLAALVGPSGAGKTTIGYLVARLYDVEGGAVLLDGVDVRHLSEEARTRLVGFVTQESFLFHGTIEENLRYARPDATGRDVEEAARAAAIHDRILALPDGYATVVGERGYRLSGGEKQRISIARALLHDPRVLILDEATSALDTTSERLVQEALQRLMRGRTSIAIAHRLSTIRAADVIYGIEGGRVVEHGTHDQLLAARGLYARLYAEQFGGGQVEARCANGVRMADGRVLPLHAVPAPA